MTITEQIQEQRGYIEKEIKRLMSYDLNDENDESNRKLGLRFIESLKEFRFSLIGLGK